MAFVSQESPEINKLAISQTCTRTSSATGLYNKVSRYCSNKVLPVATGKGEKGYVPWAWVRYFGDTYKNTVRSVDAGMGTK